VLPSNISLRTSMSICSCTNKHIPKPIIYIVVEVNGEKINLCPTAAFNLHSLLGEWHNYAGEPPGSVTKHYGHFIRGLAKAKMMCYDGAQTYERTENV
jgi:hypothetical protein